MHSEIITLEGHIIDSHVLAGVLDDIIAFGGEFHILEVHVGQTRTERSHARIELRTESEERMQQLLAVVSKRGAIWSESDDCRLAPADLDGAFPEDFYSTTNQQTLVRHAGRWMEVQRQEMDCAIRQEGDGFACVPIARVRRGDVIVCGQHGVRVVPFERQRARGVFEFMASEVSTEKPKNTMIRNCAALMVEARRAGKRLLLVGGPAIVHSGAVPHVVGLIERGYVQVLFAGNALAVHDIEHDLFGTSLGVYIDKATLADAGHEHHLRAINTVRRAGGIRRAIEAGLIRGGIMHACVTHNIDFVLAGSIRDDGPLPEVETDALVAQDRMRAAVGTIGFALMVATGLHAIATGNLLPAWVPAVYVDISPAIISKLADRGSFQTLGIVTDVEPFFRSLLAELEQAEGTKEEGTKGRRVKGT